MANQVKLIIILLYINGIESPEAKQDYRTAPNLQTVLTATKRRGGWLESLFRRPTVHGVDYMG